MTLAEVLITLGIIGIVAAMTIPTLMNNIQDAQYKTAYKKAFSLANQALLSANQQNLLIATTGEGDNVNHKNNFLAFMAQFKTTKQCLNNNNQECWNVNGEKFLIAGGYPASASYAFVDASGVSWSMYYAGYCMIFVDTNGFKKPNRWGKDRFILLLQSAERSTVGGLPIKVIPLYDNNMIKATFICKTPNECFTKNDYYGAEWLYQ